MDLFGDDSWRLSWRGWRRDIATAFAFLTRLPVPGDAAGGGLADAARAFPLVGLAIGLIAAAVFAVGHWLGLPPFATGLLAVAAGAAITGALHEDGLADTADGLGGGRDPEEKLAIMRDSRIGTYGVLALLFSVLLRAGALAGFAGWCAAAGALLAAHAAARAGTVALMHGLPLARDDGLAVAAGRPDRTTMVWALAFGAAAVLIFAGIGPGLVALALGAAAMAAVGLLARRQVGGITGDVLGAAEQAGEIAVLLTLAAFA